MTAQITDTVWYKERDYSIAGVQGEGLFDPANLGLKVVMLSTACYRGFYCKYSILDNELRLTRLAIGFDEQDWKLAESGQGPVLFGKTPTREQRDCTTYDAKTGKEVPSKYWSDFCYDGLNERVCFTGGLLLGDDFIWEMYVHMGFHPAYKFRDVHEFIFESGKVVKATDLSAMMAKVREEIANRPLEPKDPYDEQKMLKWIESSFSLKYRL